MIFEPIYLKGEPPYKINSVYLEITDSYKICFLGEMFGNPNLRQSQIAKFMGPAWGPPGSCRPQMGPMLAPWILLSAHKHLTHHTLDSMAAFS